MTPLSSSSSNNSSSNKPAYNFNDNYIVIYIFQKKWHNAVVIMEKCMHNSLFPDRWQHLPGLVVSSKSVDSAFDQNQTELGILVLKHFITLATDLCWFFI